MASHYISDLEWEPLDIEKSWSVANPDAFKAALRNVTIDEVLIARDENWNLTAKAMGTASGFRVELTGHELRAGEFMVPIPEVHLSQLGGARTAVIRDVYVTGHQSKINVNDGTCTVTVALHLDEFEIHEAHIRGEEPTTCLVWCLNTPNEFTRMTKRQQETQVTRSRGAHFPHERRQGSSSTSRDWIVVPPPQESDQPGVLARVPESVVTPAVRPGSLEFKLDALSDLDIDNLAIHLDALGFVFGRNLIPIGYTVLTENSNIQKQVLRSARQFEASSTAAAPDMQPTPFGGHGDPDLTEATVNQVTSGLLTRRGQFGLEQAVSLLWTADAARLDICLTEYSMALESIVSAWYKSNKSKSKGKYLPDVDWRAAISGQIEQIEVNLKGHEFTDRMLRRVSGANSFGANERMEFFFGEIGLPISDVERATMKARNKSAHGGAFKAAEMVKTSMQRLAYRTLINRVILKLIQFDGMYIDYSTYGFPTRHVDEPLGGPEGDGIPA